MTAYSYFDISIQTLGDRNRLIDFSTNAIGAYGESLTDEDRRKLFSDLVEKNHNQSLAEKHTKLHFYYVSTLAKQDSWQSTGIDCANWLPPSSYRRLNKEVNEILVHSLEADDPFAFFFRGSLLFLDRNLSAACEFFRKSTLDPGLPNTLGGVLTVPEYDAACSIPDLCAEPLLTEEHFHPLQRYGDVHRYQPYILFAADAHYFQEYARQTVESLDSSSAGLNILFGVHCSADKVGSIADHFDHICANMHADNHLSLVQIRTPEQPVKDMRAFYGVMRLYLAEWFLHTHSTGLVTCDIDISFKADYQGHVLKSLPGTDVGLNFNRGVKTYVPWRTINANCIGMSHNKQAQVFLGYLLKFINYFFERDADRQWFIDQQGLFWTYRFITRFIPGIRCINNYEAGVEFKTVKKLSDYVRYS